MLFEFSHLCFIYLKTGVTFLLSREQNQRLVALSQEKARLDVKHRANFGASGDDPDVVARAFSNKQIILKQLQDKLTDQDKLVCMEQAFYILSLKQSFLYKYQLH